MKTNHTPHTYLAFSARASLPWAWLLALLFVLAIVPGMASAQTGSYVYNATCWFTNSSGTPINPPTTQSVTLNPITIPVPSPPVAGNLIGNPVSATASTGTIYMNCWNNSTTGGLTPVYGTYKPANNTIYSPTPGIAFQIQRQGTPIPLYPNGSYRGSLITFSNTTTFQLFSTGVLPSSGNQIPAGTLLGKWQFDNICTSVSYISYFFGGYYQCDNSANGYTIINFYSGGVTFTASTCNVSTGSQNLTVTLPPVLASSLTSAGTTAGTTPFNINLTGCTSNLKVSATLNTNNPYASANGVVAPTTGSGYASNVGIQLLQSDGATPVTFNTAFQVGTTSGTSFTFGLNARYYQTASPVTPGKVQATATYTLTYQ